MLQHSDIASQGAYHVNSDTNLNAGAASNAGAAPDSGSASTGSADAAEWARLLRTQLATFSGGLAPDVYANAWWDWYLNLSTEPVKQAEIVQDAFAKAVDTWNFALQAASGQPLTPSKDDSRYANEAWSQWPFNVVAHGYLNTIDWWQKSLSGVRGVAPDNERTLEFLARNAGEVISPSNYLSSNPELLETTRAESGQNLIRGFKNWVEDVEGALTGKGSTATDGFVVGRDVAAAPGKVVLRNALAELIQYSPQTDQVLAEPILIVPAWIMKYYILDLSAKNSLVKYLVSQGHTVFMVSWKNPDAADRDLGMDDYLKLGIADTVDAVSRIVPGRKIHSVGYCIGGTLLSIAAADFAAAGDERLASVTLLAAQQDFSEPGELSLFVSPSQLDMLEAVMERAGVLKSEQMGGAFALLRARDLLWTPAVNTYLRGKRETPNDLMAWNADGTRMPCRMHSEYLRGLYLNNALALGEFKVAGRSVDLGRITVPMFVVGTETDHVAPWRSVYKARRLTRSVDFTFLLTSGGHNAGIISGPVHPRRRHRVRTWSNATDTLSPQEWLDTTPPTPGSWWPVWDRWLAEHSSKPPVTPPGVGSAKAGYPPIADAPGEYVLRK